MPVDIKTGFADGDLLRDIRTKLLNPIAVKVDALETGVSELRTETGKALQTATVNTPAKTIQFTKGAGAPITADLTGMFREGSDLQVEDKTGTTYSNVTKMDMVDSQITQTTSGEVEVHYDWADLVPKYQNKLAIGKTGVIATTQPNALYFKGGGITLDTGTPNITTVEFPTPTKPLKASIQGGAAPSDIEAIVVEGETAASHVTGGVLTLNLSKGGGGIDNQNFKGIFESLGDLTSAVSDAINGKSFAYVKDALLGGKYYTAYYYVNNNWKELSQDPALTYNAPSEALNQGVFSIKPSEKITIDQNGQLNLDGLSTPQLPQYFAGFFETLQELKDTVKNPVSKQTYAFVRSGGGRGWLTYRADMRGSASLWDIVAPLGSFTFVDEGTQSFTQVFGIKKSDAWNVDSRGLLELKAGGPGPGPGGPLSVGISGYDNQVVTHDIKAITFNRGKSFAEFTGNNKDHVLIDHPQRIIKYNSTWEAAHNSQDYEGNIFYDESSRCWMGYSIPSATGAVGAKWTRIAHEDMSLEVKDLVKRVPAKAASIEVGLTEDSGSWAYNGVTFLDQDSTALPDEIRNTCGGYITTIVQDKDNVGVTIPQYRMQICVADQEGGETYMRRLKATGSPGAAMSWSPWVRTSFSKKDINAHEENPAAHKNVIKYHKVTSISGNAQAIYRQQAPTGTQKGFLRGGNCDLLVDNYGYTQGTDYLEFPYAGDFRIKGSFFLSGFTSNSYVASSWIVTLIKHSSGGSQTLVGQYTYSHTNKNLRYPPIFFLTNNVKIEEGDKVYIQLKCDQIEAITTTNPHLYFVPLKSQIVVEDMGTLSGSMIGESYRKHLANLNAFGDLEVKAHFPKYEAADTVRVYGDKVNKTPVEMK